MYNIREKLNKDNIGLYRDDGLAYFNNNNGHQNDKIRKELIKIFQTHGLKLKIKCNLKSVDYLHITFDLDTGSHRPYRKQNNDTRYINTKSNHPPSIPANAHALGHMMYGLSCHKAIVVITRRAHCFHDNIYIYMFS